MRTQAGMSSRVGIILVESLHVVRAGLSLLIASEEGLEIVAACGGAREAIEAIRRIRSHRRLVVLVDLELPGERDAFWLVRTIREQFPQVIVLVTGTGVDRVAISRALFVGSDGFIHKDADPLRVGDAIRRAAEGQIVLEGLPRGALGRIVEGFDLGRSTSAPLTAREREVLAVAAEGLTAKQMARRLGIGERTVTTHLYHIYQKLGANGRVAAVTLGVASGLITSPSALHGIDTRSSLELAGSR